MAERKKADLVDNTQPSSRKRKELDLEEQRPAKRARKNSSSVAQVAAPNNEMPRYIYLAFKAGHEEGTGSDWEYDDGLKETYDTECLGTFVKMESAIERARLDSEDFEGEDQGCHSTTPGVVFFVEKIDYDTPAAGCGFCYRWWVERHEIDYQ